MTKYPALYEVNLYVYENNRTNQYHVCGILYTENFADAAKQLEEYYGNEIGDMKIELYEDGLIEFHPKHLPFIRQILNEYINGSAQEEVSSNGTEEMWGMCSP